MNYKQFGNIDTQVLSAIEEVLKFSDPNIVKASIILNRIRTILGVKELDTVPDFYEALKLTRDNLQTLSDATLHYKNTFGANLKILNKALAKADSKEV